MQLNLLLGSYTGCPSIFTICSHLKKEYLGIEAHQWQKRLSKCHLISPLIPSVPFLRAENFSFLCHFSFFFHHITGHIYFRMLIVDKKPTKSKEIGPVVEEQEEQQFSDGADGPSNRSSRSRILRVLAHKFRKKQKVWEMENTAMVETAKWRQLGYNSVTLLVSRHATHLAAAFS